MMSAFLYTGFLNYIIAEENSIFNPNHRVVYQDMRQPLCHYFIATSHNTYATNNVLRNRFQLGVFFEFLCLTFLY